MYTAGQISRDIESPGSRFVNWTKRRHHKCKRFVCKHDSNPGPHVLIRTGRKELEKVVENSNVVVPYWCIAEVAKQERSLTV